MTKIASINDKKPLAERTADALQAELEAEAAVNAEVQSTLRLMDKQRRGFQAQINLAEAKRKALEAVGGETWARAVYRSQGIEE